MIQILPILLVSFLCLFGARCAHEKQPPRQGTSSTETFLKNYGTLQTSADQFIEEIGSRGEELVLGLSSEPATFNPLLSGGTEPVTSLLFDGLTGIDQVTQRVVPALAESWECSEDSLLWTFHLRKSVRWADSSRFSAYDVAFTFNKLLTDSTIVPQTLYSLFAPSHSPITVTATDSHTVEIRLPHRYAVLLRVLTIPIVPKHIIDQAMRTGSFADVFTHRTAPDSVIGTGPFILESYIPSRQITLNRNPHYWKTDSSGTRLPYLDRVVYTLIRDRSIAVHRFKMNQIDMVACNGTDYEELKRWQPDGDYTLYRLGPAMGSMFLLLNQNQSVDTGSAHKAVPSFKRSWFRNEKFRKALAHAIDRQTMIDSVLSGFGVPQWGPMSVSEGYYYNETVPRYPCDTVRAQHLLIEAGFRDSDNDGVIEDGSGEKVAFTISVNSGNPIRGQIAQHIARDLKRIGIQCDIRTIPFDSLMQTITSPPYSYEAAVLALDGCIDPHFAMNIWHSASSLHLWAPRQDTASTAWEAAIDSLFLTAAAERDTAKRKVMYDRWQYLAARHLPLIFLVVPERIYGVSKSIGNVNPSPYARSLLHNIEYLFVKPAPPDTESTEKKLSTRL
jgi:peptide/nickel transport system substrate-binding protein